MSRADVLFDVEYLGSDIRYDQGHSYNGVLCDLSDGVISNDVE